MALHLDWHQNCTAHKQELGACIWLGRSLHERPATRLEFRRVGPDFVVGFEMARTSMTTLAIKTSPAIKAARVSDEAPAIAVVVMAFSADPAVRWAWPDANQYLTHFPSFVRAFGGNAFPHESAYYLDGYAGAALWLPPAVHPDEDAMMTLLQRTGSEQAQKDGPALFEQMGRYHPQEPHWYLPFIGVDPLQQGKGYGTVLMEHALIPCDRDHTLAYLESSNPKNIPFYERHGFELLGTIQVGTSPPIFPMLRKPRR